MVSLMALLFYHPGERASPGTLWTGDWVGPRGAMKKIKLSCLCRKQNPDFFVFQLKNKTCSTTYNRREHNPNTYVHRDDLYNNN
jgi:hypothetical protein